MTNSTSSNTNASLYSEKDGFDGGQTDLHKDPDFIKLLELYQKAQFSECLVLLESLEARYPGNPELQTLKEDLSMRASLKNMTSAIKKGETRAKSKGTIRLIAFALVGTIAIVAVFFASSVLFLKDTTLDNSADVSAQLSSLYIQADHLLEGGQPAPALEIVEKIRQLDPDYPELPVLVERTDALMAFEAKYRQAVSLDEQGQQDEALVLLKELETEHPGMWDIPQRVTKIEQKNQIANYQKAGNSAYLKEEWDKVIESYESALSLDQSLNDPVMVEQLLFAYLNRIIALLQSDNNAIEELDLAEQYYRKATALIPQNKEFANQRANLQEVSSNLLEQKFTQIAKASLADKNQTMFSIAKAVSYFRKALNLNPKNAALQADATNAEVYQMAFQDFVDMDWTAAVTKFEKVITADKNFADGNAKVLLYEAYYALGKQYLNAGIYVDARTYLEQAEILAWSDGDNRLKLFQVQVLLGDSIAELDDFKNAVSYYQYALDAIQVQEKFRGNAALVDKYSEATALAANGDYPAASVMFQELLEQVDFVYKISEVDIGSGVCLALFASDHSSTLDAILKANNLPKNMVLSFGRTLSVPSIQN